MVLFLIKMQALIFSVRLVILLATVISCNKFTGNTTTECTFCQRINHPSSQMQAFDDLGVVNIKAPGITYIVERNIIFVKGSYSHPEVKLAVVTQINDQPNNSSTSWAGSMSADDGQSFVPDLQILNLETSHLYNVTSDLFISLSDANVRYLNLGYTVIRNIAEDTLKPLRTSLRILGLANATILEGDLNALMKGLRDDTDEGSSSLIVLSLASLGLTSVPYEALKSVQYSLRAVSFFNNNFRMKIQNITELIKSVDSEVSESEFDNVEENIANYLKPLLQEETNYNVSMGSIWANFPVMPYLVELDLRQCNINSIARGTFRNLTNLKRLYISRNNILVLQNLAFDGLANLQVLDISRNFETSLDSEITSLTLKNRSLSGMFSLNILNLSYTSLRRSTTHFLRRSPTSLITLDLRGTDLMTLIKETFKDLTNLKTLNLSDNFGLGSDLSSEAFYGLDRLQELYMVKTALHSLEAFQYLSSLKVLDVKQNNLESLEGLLENLPLLECLDVSYNYISSWLNGSAFASNPKLQSVFLHANSLSLMSSVMLEDFKSLTHLSLGYNGFICNCPLKSFVEYLVDLNNGTFENLPILVDYQSRGTSYICTDVSVSETFRFIDIEDYCTSNTTQYWLTGLQHGIYISLLTVVCTMSVGGLLYWKWWYIRYVAVFIKNATVMSMINVENCEDRIYTYDIFVSYSDVNRDWVVEELIPNLEGPDARFSICLHERDFQVGVSILENISMGMDESRTILLIISGFFLKSQWCQFEMHLAQHRLLETCREELVLVLLEEIPRRKRPKTLHYLMMVKTYIVWPKNSEDRNAKKLFWKRLRRAITANKSKCA